MNSDSELTRANGLTSPSLSKENGKPAELASSYKKKTLFKEPTEKGLPKKYLFMASRLFLSLKKNSYA